MSRSRSAPEEIVAASGLPDPIRSVVLTVVTASRLWPRERADVARELIAHFRDGLEAGESKESLLDSFGDPRVTARLIRRGKVRSRPLAWRAMRGAVHALGALVALLLLIYTFALVRFYTSEPRVTRDYLAELNEPIRTLPQESRAWPLYRRAFLSLPPMPADFEMNLPPEGPDDPIWGDTLAYLERIGPTLELVKIGAARPRLGLELRREFDREIAEHRAFISGQPPPPPDVLDAGDDSALYAVLLPHLGTTRLLSRLLVAEARAALAAGDPRRWEESATALLGLANHSREPAYLIAQLVSISLNRTAAQEVGRLLRDSPEILDDNALQRIAHRLAALGPRDLQVSFDLERRIFDDFVQRAYSDDGRGGGRLTAKGLRTIEGFTATRNPVSAALDPAASLVMAGRRDTLALYHRLIDLTEAEIRRPLWEWEGMDFDAEFERAAGGPLARHRYYPMLLMIPALHRSGFAGYHAEQVRDATLVAIALELFRRRAGEYPASLDALVPALLPEVPRDQFTGGPIGYLLRDGQPLIYSFGADRKDDHGRPVADNPDNAARWVAPADVSRRLMQPNPRDNIDGDWILWPQPRANRAGD